MTLLDRKLITQMIMMKNDKDDKDDDLPLKKTLEIHNMIIVVTAVFHEDNNITRNLS